MCEHKFIYMETNKSHHYDGPFNTHWIRIDRFFCEKCLEYRDKKQEDWSRDKPEWY